MSPEIIKSQSDFTEQSDVWALGILTIQLLDGEYPFNGRGYDLVFQIVENESPWPKKKVSFQMKKFLEGCL